MARQFAIGTFVTATLAAVTTASAADVTVNNGWFRALPSGLPAGGYFSLHNAGATPVELVAAKSTACGMLMFHQSITEGGVSRMKEVKRLALPAGGTVNFAPGGYHLMCMSPTPAMTPGGHVRVSFVFSHNNRIDADFTVRAASGK